MAWALAKINLGRERPAHFWGGYHAFIYSAEALRWPPKNCYGIRPFIAEMPVTMGVNKWAGIKSGQEKVLVDGSIQQLQR